MLIVLLAMVAIASGVVALAREAASLSHSARVSMEARAADDLLAAADTPIRHWLSRSASSTVLPPDATRSHVPLLCDRVALGAMHAEIQIDAFDACGPTRINIATAPMDQVAASLAHLGTGPAAAIRAARDEARLPHLPGATYDQRSMPGTAPRVQLVNVSSRWRFVVRVRCGTVTRALELTLVSSGEQWLVEERRPFDD
jgi:hypothetical protein